MFPTPQKICIHKYEFRFLRSTAYDQNHPIDLCTIVDWCHCCKPRSEAARQATAVTSDTCDDALRKHTNVASGHYIFLF